MDSERPMRLRSAICTILLNSKRVSDRSGSLSVMGCERPSSFFSALGISWGFSLGSGVNLFTTPITTTLLASWPRRARLEARGPTAMAMAMAMGGRSSNSEKRPVSRRSYPHLLFCESEVSLSAPVFSRVSILHRVR